MLGRTEIYNPLREPDWRTQRVDEILVSGRLPSRDLDDELIWDYWRYRREWNATDHQDRHFNLQDWRPDLHYAHVLRQDRQTDLPAIIEARILAGQDDQAIARTVGTMPETIDSYELLFFHVRDRLNVEDWILQVVLSGQLRANAIPPATQHKRLLYRLAGYAGGPEALEQVLSGTRSIQRDRKAAAGGHWCEQELTRTLRFKGLQAARLVEVTSENALAIIGLMLKLIELDQRERLAARQDGDEESTPILDMARSVFGNLKLMMGDEAYQDASPELRAVLDNPIEPRLRDQMRLSKCPGGLHGQLAEMEAEYDAQRKADGPHLADPPVELCAGGLIINAGHKLALPKLPAA